MNITNLSATRWTRVKVIETIFDVPNELRKTPKMLKVHPYVPVDKARICGIL